MQRKFIYFINPIAGSKKNKHDLLQLISQKTTARKIPFEIIETKAEGDYSFLVTKVIADKITDVIICGGDGTINQVAGSLLNTEVNIGIIPIGSGNGLALTAGIARDPDKALSVIFNGEYNYIDSFYINDLFSCMLCGLGFDAKVAHGFAKHPSRGLSTYIKLSVKNYFSASSYPFTINANEIEIKSDAFFISIANANQFGNNFTIAPKASLSDGLLDIVIVNKMSKLTLLYQLLKQISTGRVQHVGESGFHKKNIQYFQTKQLTILNPQLAPLHIDGEPAITEKLFTIKIIHNAFRLLQPH